MEPDDVTTRNVYDALFGGLRAAIEEARANPIRHRELLALFDPPPSVGPTVYNTAAVARVDLRP